MALHTALLPTISDLIYSRPYSTYGLTHSRPDTLPLPTTGVTRPYSRFYSSYGRTHCLFPQQALHGLTHASTDTLPFFTTGVTLPYSTYGRTHCLTVPTTGATLPYSTYNRRYTALHTPLQSSRTDTLPLPTTGATLPYTHTSTVPTHLPGGAFPELLGLDPYRQIPESLSLSQPGLPGKGYVSKNSRKFGVAGSTPAVSWMLATLSAAGLRCGSVGRVACCLRGFGRCLLQDQGS